MKREHVETSSGTGGCNTKAKRNTPQTPISIEISRTGTKSWISAKACGEHDLIISTYHYESYKKSSLMLAYTHSPETLLVLWLSEKA